MDASVKTVYKVSVVLSYDTVTENDTWRFVLDRDCWNVTYCIPVYFECHWLALRTMGKSGSLVVLKATSQAAMHVYVNGFNIMLLLLFLTNRVSLKYRGLKSKGSNS